MNSLDAVSDAVNFFLEIVLFCSYVGFSCSLILHYVGAPAPPWIRRLPPLNVRWHLVVVPLVALMVLFPSTLIRCLLLAMGGILTGIGTMALVGSLALTFTMWQAFKEVGDSTQESSAPEEQETAVGSEARLSSERREHG